MDQNAAKVRDYAIYYIMTAIEKISPHFKPHPGLKNGHAMTIVPALLAARPVLSDGEKLQIEVDRDNWVTGYLNRHSESHGGKGHSERPLMIVVHGLEGTARAPYVNGLGYKAHLAGFDVFRMNMRNCEDTFSLCTTLYNAGLSGDLFAIGLYLKERFGYRDIYACGFSLGGNLVLKAAGEQGTNQDHRRRRLFKAVVAVSPPVELVESVKAIERGASRLYDFNFLLSLKKKIIERERLFPGTYDLERLKKIKSLRQFDNYFTAIDAGYDCAESYYQAASAMRVLPDVKIPTLIVAAQDDPIVPYAQSFAPLALQMVRCPQLSIVSPPRGGHVNFFSEHEISLASLYEDVATLKQISLPDTIYKDRFWAEWLALKFCLYTQYS